LSSTERPAATAGQVESKFCLASRESDRGDSRGYEALAALDGEIDFNNEVSRFLDTDRAA
jgi:hypothetical protein